MVSDDKIAEGTHPTFIYLISATKDESLRNDLSHIRPSRFYRFLENTPYPINATRYPFSFAYQTECHLRAAARNQWEECLICRTSWVALRYIIELIGCFWLK